MEERLVRLVFAVDADVAGGGEDEAEEAVVEEVAFRPKVERSAFAHVRREHGYVEDRIRVIATYDQRCIGRRDVVQTRDVQRAEEHR